ncbi:amidase family protein [Pseudomonas sp. RIT623]|uniref:amidase family protein n=1 Tax=Pseudomonas sp. RIT623 TaxID=2559075 RepID=UPI0010703ED7|nr:amidase family protein [Pseudomonas sp. RIT623]TFF41304.1 amidase [Pseudomonas sp. RIT623]
MKNQQQQPANSVMGNYSPLNENPGEDFDGPIFASVITPDDNDFASISALQAQMADGTLTSADLVTRALARVAALNEQGPALKAVIEINAAALTLAQTLDTERAAGTVRGQLHGIPVLIKDNIDTGDGMQTSAGSLALVGQAASTDAYIVERLRAAGAVILGKANTSEWMGFRDMAVPEGWSGRGGQTLSARGKGMPVSGSSVGSAVGVSAGLATVAVGTETSGSLIKPAYLSQVVGMRPTHGLLGQSGIVPLSKSLDTPGPMARNVTDAAILLDAMFGTGAWSEPPTGVPTEQTDFAGGLDAAALNGARLGYRSDSPLPSSVVTALENAGATLVPVELVFPPMFADLFSVVKHEFKRDLAEYLASRPGIEVKSLADVIAFNTANPLPEEYKQGLLEYAQAQELEEADYVAAVGRLVSQSRALIDDALATHNVIALLDQPMGALPAYGANAGYPGLMVPVPGDSAVPVGLYLGGAQWSDQLLLSLGLGFERSLSE